MGDYSYFLALLKELHFWGYVSIFWFLKVHHFIWEFLVIAFNHRATAIMQVFLIYLAIQGV